MVETRQSTKAVAEILKEVFADTEIVYVKAGTVSRFRQDFKEADGLLKVRGMNDLHHAKDAYLNIVVGNTNFVKFTKNAALYVKENPGRSYNLRTMFTSKYDVTRDGEVAWKAGSNGTIATVKKVMKKNNILVTRKSYEITGGLFDQQIMKKGKGQVRIKENDDRLSIEKYGGYNKATGAYFMLVKSKGKKDEEIRTIEFVPLYLKNRLEKEETCAIEYLTKERGLKEPVIHLKKIKKDTLFKVDGFYMWLSSRTGNQLQFKGANQLIISSENERVLKKILKYADRQKGNKNATISERDNLSEEQLIGLYDTFYHKIKGTIYGVRLSAQEKTLREKRDTFIGLTKENKCLVLAEILHMFQCQSGSANLKMIGGKENVGTLKKNSNISKIKQIFVVYQSPTGIYEKEMDLKKL